MVEAMQTATAYLGAVMVVAAVVLALAAAVQRGQQPLRAHHHWRRGRPSGRWFRIPPAPDEWPLPADDDDTAGPGEVP